MGISICIPAYNRSEYLLELLDSVRVQLMQEDEIIICEDKSPEREKIVDIICDYKKSYPDTRLVLILNPVNLGYDNNLKQLFKNSTQDYCFFMGNDDLLAPGALERVRNILKSNQNIGVMSRSYSWFNGGVENIEDTVKHLPGDKLFDNVSDAQSFFFRRVGVLSGLVFRRVAALECETNEFDGHLFYQMYLAGEILKKYDGFYISTVQTFSRDGVEPDFGNSETEKQNFKPGGYVYKGRVHMVSGMLSMAKKVAVDEQTYLRIRADIAKFFYPYIRDQLSLPLLDRKSVV